MRSRFSIAGRLSYINKGYNTIEKIGTKYCIEGCENWNRLVTDFYRDGLGGDVRRLSFPAKAATPTRPGHAKLRDSSAGRRSDG